MLTYNHVKYIESAIKGVVEQKCKFNFELIIGDDYSTDGTRNVIKNYFKKYPQIIKLILQKENVGHQDNFISIYKKAASDYIAMCEGDDYWTDPLKLQKQVDFLEANADFVMCSHSVKTIYEDGVEEKDPFVESMEIATFEDILENHFIPTLSLVFRNGILAFPEWLNKILSTDIANELLLAHYGKNYYMNEVMGVKRKHPGGITQNYDGKLIKSKLYMYQNLNKHFNYEHRDFLNPKIAELLLRTGKAALMKGNILKFLIYLSKGFLKSPSVFFKKVSKYLRMQ